MPTRDGDTARFTLRILGLAIRGRVALPPPIAATAVDADADAIVSGDRATETKGALMLLKNSWADISLPLTFSLQPYADETPVNDSARDKKIRDGWVSFGFRALWYLGCIVVIYKAYHAGIYAKYYGPYKGHDGGHPVRENCDGVFHYEMPAWWAKDVLVEQMGTYDAFIFKEEPSTVAATFSRNVTLTLDKTRNPWDWNYGREVVVVKLLQRSGEKFTFDVNLTSLPDPQAHVTIEMFDPEVYTSFFRFTAKESGRYEARVPDFSSASGAFPVHLRFTLGPSANEWSMPAISVRGETSANERSTAAISARGETYANERSTAMVSASGETYKYNVSAAVASCPSKSRSPKYTPCALTSLSLFRPSHVILQDIEDLVGTKTTFVSLRERPRIIAVMSLYAPYGLVILAASVTLAFVLWNKKTPVEAWMERRAKKDIGTEEEREPMLGEDV
ncbi:hypothetical protein HK101_002004 [Irineochytrium annulatum]|nr:hypothetical protein HK101_002004 [Irineochytrium annulatum]